MERPLFSRLLPFLVAILGGAAITLAALSAVYRLTDVALPSSIVRPASALQLVEGEGKRTAGALEVTKSLAGRPVVVQAAVRPFMAERFARFSWSVQGLAPEQELRLIWATRASGARPFVRRVTDGERVAAAVDLLAEARWAGEITAIGLIISGPLHQPLVFNRFLLEPKPLTVRDILSGIAADWTSEENWTGHSINFEYSGRPRNGIPPVSQVALWLAISAVLYLAMARRWSAPQGPAPYLAMILIGWGILDLHWTSTLWERLQETTALYAGKDTSERLGAGPDRRFYPFLKAVREQISRSDARLFILSSQPDAYLAAKSRFHLFPLNSYATMTIERSTGVGPGDYVLVLGEPNPAEYDRQRESLILGDLRLPATLELMTPGLGSLFHVKAEG